jgi:integrase
MRTPSEHVAKDGTTSWKVRYRRAGRQSSVTFYGPSGRTEAVKFCKALDSVGVERALAYLADAEPDGHPGVVTLNQWADRYIRSLTGITEGTRSGYRSMYGRVWHDTLGHLPLRRLDRERIAAVVNELSATRADQTTANAHGLLSAMLAQAVDDGHIQSNPCRGIRLPRRTDHETPEHRYLDHDEFSRLLACVPEHYRPLILTLAGTGIRWGEAEALTVGDVDLDGATPEVRITKAAKWCESGRPREVGPTNTRRSRRTVVLPVQVADALRTLLDGRSSSDRLFLTPRGDHLRHSQIYYQWKRACDRAGLVPRPRIHDLRHSHVAWLVAANIPLPVIQARLGHESISTTIDTYGHLLPDLQAAAAHAASVALDGIEPKAIATADTSPISLAG